ncbi:MAG: hypothetical protein QOJ09_1558 [Actinomycetota bacterium]|nr:hypothetical protein [Actinomycetota bacterium]
MASNPPPDLVLAPINGDPKTVREWLTTFHLAFVVLDPYTYESAWLLETAGRVLKTFEQSDARTAFLLTCTAPEARAFLGPWAEDLLTFADPDRTAVKALGLQHLPAFVHLAMDGTIYNAAEGWNPMEWRKVADDLARVTAWKAPAIPQPGDPGPYEGTPALA